MSTRILIRPILTLLFLAFGAWALSPSAAADDTDTPSLFARDNLMAWCVVPFDAAKRSPEERAEMLAGLGLTKLAYDWRGEHVPTFEREILALKKHNIEFSAFWGAHEEMFSLFEKYKISPEIWITVSSPQLPTQEERVQAAAQALLPLVTRAKSLGCGVGLYNHGGWGGQPDNMLAVCRALRKKADTEQVGIVYNFHHGHEHLDDFPEGFRRMTPYLFCVNLNGMTVGGAKILPLGQGERDLEILQMIAESDYRGPIGLLDHRGELDAEESLKQNLDGLKRLLGRLGDQRALQTYND